MKKKFSITFRVEQPTLLREAIQQYGISKRALTAIKFDGGQIMVDGKEQNVRYIVQPTESVQIIFPPEEASEGLVPAYNWPFRIIYEDEYLLVLHKPPFMNSIPSKEHPIESVANYIVGYYEEQQLASTVHIVTRLDRDTSGLMCIAKHRHVHHLMSEQQKRGDIHREYEAIVEGHVADDFIEIKAPIGRKDTSIIEREVREDGQFSHTNVTVLKRFEKDGHPMTHIRLKLFTGRTHQIRVHCAYIGHPLVGDELYGGNHLFLPHQALQCVNVSFVHPITNEQMELNDPLLEQFLDLMQS